MPSPTSPHWIDTAEALAAAAESWRRHEAIGLDTEFVRERSFFPRLGLIQISDPSAVFLVDPQALDDLGPLEEILRDREVVKVAHSCSEDMEVLFHRFGSFPQPLFDTQIAASLGGLEASMSYQRLVHELLDEEVVTGETRTDWLQRPLSPAQSSYAASDVTFLLPLYHRLHHALQEKGRLSWVLEESRRLENPARFLPDPERCHLRLSHGGLDRRQLAALQALASWRERQARNRDLPRSFVLRDSSLLALARRLPRRLEDMERIPDLHPRQARRHGESLLALVRTVRRIPERELPAPPPTLPRQEWVKKVLGRMQEVVHGKARELDLPASVLASRKDIKELLVHHLHDDHGPPPPPFDGWRWQILGPPLIAALEEVRRQGVLPPRAAAL
jgi:ribonuclease D